MSNSQKLTEVLNNLKLAKHNLALVDINADRGYSRSVSKLIEEITKDLQSIRNYEDRLEAYRAGWMNAACWAKRDDLISDIGSPEYIKDRDTYLKSKNETQS